MEVGRITFLCHQGVLTHFLLFRYMRFVFLLLKIEFLLELLCFKVFLAENQFF